MWHVVLLSCVCAAAAVELGHLRSHSHESDDIFEDARLKVPELVRKYDYPLEEHYVNTSDGYILTMHRIPHGRHTNQTADRPVVFIMHGLLSSSADFVIMGPGKGLAYILAEEGYDVWLGNARGNRYSRAHIILDPDGYNTGFWHFSWDEIGNIDLPNMIDYVLEKTGRQQMHYIGHSQGTTAFFVMCSLRREYNQKIISMNALAPAVYMAHSGCLLLRVIARFSNILSGLLEVIGVNEFFPNTKILRWAGEKLCKDEAITQEICSNIVFLLMGWNEKELNQTMLPVNLGHVPAGASVRQFAHYGQNVASKEFRRFNHGWWKNREVYGTLSAPLYDLSQVKAPVYLHYSLADPLVNVKDVERLWKEVGNPVEKFIVPLSSFSHLDFIWGIHAKELLYDQIISILRRYDIRGDVNY